MAGAGGLELAELPRRGITYVHCMRKPPHTAPVLQATLIRQLKLFNWTVAPLGPSGFPTAYVHSLTLGNDAKAWNAIELWKGKATNAAFLVVVWTKGGRRSLSVYDLVHHTCLEIQNIAPTTAKEDGVKLARRVNQWMMQT